MISSDSDVEEMFIPPPTPTPATAQPAAAQLATAQPATAQPATAQPATAQPGAEPREEPAPPASRLKRQRSFPRKCARIQTCAKGRCPRSFLPLETRLIGCSSSNFCDDCQVFFHRQKKARKEEKEKKEKESKDENKENERK